MDLCRLVYNLLKITPSVIPQDVSRFSIKRYELFTLFVPSHDRHNKRLRCLKQKHWTHESMQLVADKFEGATAFATIKGVYKDRTHGYLWDKPVVIQSCAGIPMLMDRKILHRIRAFSGEMKTDTNQACVMYLIRNKKHLVEDK